MPIDFVRALRGLVVASSLGCVLGACSEPLQNGGVVVFGGASARFDAMCRFRRGSEGSASSCVPAASEAPHATVVRVASEGQLFKGSRAEGSVGDVLLSNGEIAIVFGGANSAKPGIIVDVVDMHIGQDELGSLSTCIADGADCLPLGPLEMGQERDGSAWVEVRVAGQKPFDARTRYILMPGARSLLVSTIVSSQSIEPVRLSRIGDLVAWGSAQQIVPGGEVPAFVAGIGTEVAYAIMSADDRSSVTVEATEGATLVRHAHDVAVSAGHPLRRDRALVVAPRGDSLGVLTEMALLRDGQAPGAIDVKFVGTDGSPVVPPAGGRVRLLTPAFPVVGYLTVGLSPDGPGVAGEAPAGKYEIDFEGTRRRAAVRVPVEVRPGEVTSVTLTITNQVVEAAP